MAEVAPNSAETQRLLDAVRAGDRPAFDRLFARHRSYLHQFVSVCLDPKLLARVDPSDLVQEAQLEAVRRIDAYLARPAMPFRLWLRQLARDRLLKARRHHLHTARRSVRPAVPPPRRSSPPFPPRVFA